MKQACTYSLQLCSLHCAIVGVVNPLLAVAGDVPTFERVVLTYDTQLPGDAAHVFTELGVPALRDGRVVFWGKGSGGAGQGIYSFNGQTLGIIANHETNAPSGMGTFTSFSTYPATANGEVVFKAIAAPYQTGIYKGVPGQFVRVVDTNMVIPGETTEFGFISEWASIDAGRVSFTSAVPGFPPFVPPRGGVYQFADDSLSVVADLDTPQPGGMGNFGSISLWATGTDGENITFFGANSVFPSSLVGVYRSQNSIIQTVFDTTMTIPGGTGLETRIGDFSTRNGKTALMVSDDDGTLHFSEQVVFLTSNDSIEVIANLKTPVPDGIGTFTRFFELQQPGSPQGPLPQLSFDGRHVAFLGYAVSPSFAIYTNLTEGLTQVIGRFDDLDDRTVIKLVIGRQAIDGRSIAFLSCFSTDECGIYLARYPIAPGDADEDNDVDSRDIARFMNCFGGMDVPSDQPDCRNSDSDNDNDADLVDWNGIIGCLSAPGVTSPCD